MPSATTIRVHRVPFPVPVRPDAFVHAVRDTSLSPLEPVRAHETHVLPPSLGQARDIRLAEFLAGRHCATAALHDAGMPEHVDIPIGPQRGRRRRP